MDTIYVIRELSGVRGDFGRQVFSCKLLNIVCKQANLFQFALSEEEEEAPSPS